jgi:ketosteroid isomerase-like protein
MSTENEVRKASAQFYAALNHMINGDAGPLGDIWSHNEDVTTMHPIGGREVGWGEVRGPWEQVASISSSGQVELDDQLIRVGDDIAYELGTERGQAVMAGEQVPLEHRVTNIYRREGGTWKIVHHHTDLSPEMMELIQRLQG